MQQYKRHVATCTGSSFVQTLEQKVQDLNHHVYGKYSAFGSHADSKTADHINQYGID